VSTSVAVLGGGVGGLSAAHELAERGFAVTVYESRAGFGGKARSIPVPGSASGGRADLPAEHGFRFFPGFYRHLPDTMSRIPGRGRERVSDDLAPAEAVMIARDDARHELVAPAHAPASIDDFAALTRFLVAWLGELEIDAREQAFFLDRLMVLLTSCDERRLGQWERQSWWSFVQADRRSPAFQRFLADGLTRTLVAAQAREISARTGGYILLQLLFDLSRAGGRADRLLDAPTNDVWIDPWVEHLRAAGVELHAQVDVVGIDCRSGRIEGVTIERNGARGVIAADHYVAALPVEQFVKLLSPSLVAAEPRLRRLHLLRTRWMNGIVFYLRRDVPVVPGHTIYIDSDWALTSISQRQFWPRVDFAQLGYGNVGGILSVDISDWERPSRRTGKVASMCSAEEIKDEVWAQLKDHLNANGDALLDDANLVGWYLDDDISFPNPTAAANAEPLLINTAGSWANRPEAVTAVPNLFLAADFVRTHTDLATMEGANEAARRAVNGILDATSSTAARCPVWPLREPALFWPARAVDRIRWKLLRLPAKPPFRVTASGGLQPVGVTGRVLARYGATRRPRRPR
jgi:uncharacterized protein with NAD-binding domain and iron-sulfur cluster